MVDILVVEVDVSICESKISIEVEPLGSSNFPVVLLHKIQQSGTHGPVAALL